MVSPRFLPVSVPGLPDNDSIEKRVVSLENDKKGKNQFWAMEKIIVWVTFMVLASWFVLYEMLDIFVFKDQHAFLYEMFMFAMFGILN